VEQSIAQEVEENKKKEDVRTTLDYTQNTALGFLLKKMPNTFVVACRVLTEIRYRQPKFNPKNFLDFGAGMGFFFFNFILFHINIKARVVGRSRMFTLTVSISWLASHPKS
jgi:ribosomal protein RSM22 (predicted rRNA methylase)